MVKKSKFHGSFTAERLREVLHYDPDTGVFTARYTHRKRKVGSILGNVSKKGYLYFWFEGRAQAAHRMAWLYVHGEWPKDQIDHINRNPADNRIANLRECTNAENRQNIKPEGYGKSGRLGVVQDSTGKWRASIGLDGKRVHLGCFDTIEEAYGVYQEAKQKTHAFYVTGVSKLNEEPS